MNALLLEPIYRSTEMARLIHLRPGRVARWLRGDRPVLSFYHGQKAEAFSFLDLIELRIIRGLLRDDQLSLQRVRKVHEEAQELFKTEHPFATNTFYVFGKSVATAYPHPTASKSKREMRFLAEGGQLGLWEVVVTVGKEIRFDREGFAREWWPEERHVRLTPNVSFGQPFVGNGTTTRVIADMFEAEGEDAKKVARFLALTPALVKEAVAFERTIRTAA